jgi:hypothetical protein
MITGFQMAPKYMFFNLYTADDWSSVMMDIQALKIRVQEPAG